MGPNAPRPAWYDAATAWAALKGLIRSKHPTKQRLNSFWCKMYCHGNSKKSELSALVTALSPFSSSPRTKVLCSIASSGGHSDDVAFNQSHHGTACGSTHPDRHLWNKEELRKPVCCPAATTLSGLSLAFDQKGLPWLSVRLGSLFTLYALQ